MAEANESPHEAARRELREELALDVPLRGILCIDWVLPYGPWDDQLSFIFDGGTLKIFRNYLADLDPIHVGPGHHLDHVRDCRGFRKASLTIAQTDRLRPHDHELSACAFFPVDEALSRLRPRIRQRTSVALEALRTGIPHYLEDGYPPQ